MDPAQAKNCAISVVDFHRFMLKQASLRRGEKRKAAQRFVGLL